MPTLQERIETRERRVRAEQAELAKLRKQLAERERQAKRDAERKAREQERADALRLWRWLHEHTVNYGGVHIGAYDYVIECVIPRADDVVKEE